MDKKQVNNEWLELCKYVHDEILQYGSELKFPKYLALRLRGLADGQFLANKKQKPMGNYSYNTILYTFKICKAKILQYLIANQTKFTDEKHKINSIMLFIESEINDVTLRLKRVEQSNIKVENLKMENQTNEGVEYRSKTTQVNKDLDELW
jgi:hypothetical protein